MATSDVSKGPSRAIVQRVLGGPEVLVLEDRSDPEPGAGQVRIAVEAAGVHLIDTRLRAGTAPMGAPELPMVPGREVAGVVDVVAGDVDPTWLGRRVVAHLGMASGGYATAAIADHHALFGVPDHVTATDAVAMVGTGRTALGVLAVADVQASDVVLVTGAAGGMGALLVQAALRAGALVVGAAAGEAKVAAVEAQGVELAVDYGRDDWAEVVEKELGAKPVSLVLDGVGGAIGRTAFELCSPGAGMVLFGFASGQPLSFGVGELIGAGVAVEPGIGPRVAALAGEVDALAARALDALASGALVPVVHPPFALADAAEAHRAVEARETIGKVVLVP